MAGATAARARAKAAGTPRVVTDPEVLAVLLAPIRSQLMHSLVEPKTVKEIADDLDLIPNKLYYHLRRLEEAGFVEVIDTIAGRVPERVYRAVEFELDPSAWQAADASTATNAILRNLQREIQAAFLRVGSHSQPASIMVAQVPTRLTQKQFDRYQRKIGALLEELATERPSRGARTYQVMAAMYPVDLDA